QRRRLAEIVDVFLVSYSEHQHLCSIQCLSSFIQCLRHLFVVRHAQIHFSRQFDETYAEIKLLSLPGEIKRMNWNAMPTQSWTRIEGLKAERLGGCGADHFENIDAHA